MTLTKNYEIRIKLVCSFIFPTTAMKNDRYTYTLEKSKVFVNFRGDFRTRGKANRTACACELYKPYILG